MAVLKWRVQSDMNGFDELVVSAATGAKECLIHAEMMSGRDIFVSIGPLRVWATVRRDGTVEVTNTEQDAAPT